MKRQHWTCINRIYILNINKIKVICFGQHKKSHHHQESHYNNTYMSVTNSKHRSCKILGHYFRCKIKSSHKLC